MSLSPLEENVKRKDVDGRLEAAGISGDQKDISTVNRSWKSYFWDSWDKSPEVRDLISFVLGWLTRILANNSKQERRLILKV